MVNQMEQTAAKGIVGTVAPLLGVLTSRQEEVLWILRVGSLVVGILVGILTLISLVRRLGRDLRDGD